MLQQGWYLVKIPLLHSHIIWAMHILGLFSTWGTSRICPAWFPSEYQLAPALSPIWGPRPKPCRPKEVVYSLNDSCSHFTQRLFLRNFLSNIMDCFLRYIQHHSYLLCITFTRTIISFIYMTYSHFHFSGSSWQAGCPWSFVSDTQTIFQTFNDEVITFETYFETFHFTACSLLHTLYSTTRCFTVAINREGGVGEGGALTLRPPTFRPLWHLDPLETSTVTLFPCDT